MLLRQQEHTERYFWSALFTCEGHFRECSSRQTLAHRRPKKIQQVVEFIEMPEQTRISFSLFDKD